MKRAQVVSCLILILVSFSPLLLSSPFFDDWVFIFNPELATYIKNPLVHFDINNPMFRAWPMSHMFYFFYREMGTFYAPLFFLLHVFVHVLNCYLLLLILKEFRLSRPLLLVGIFAFSPAAVFAIGQLVQMNTLFATTFFLLATCILLAPSCVSQNTNIKPALAVLLVFISLLFKPTFVLLATPAILYLILRENRTGSRIRLSHMCFVILTASMCLYSYWVTNRGVTENKSEKHYSHNFQGKSELTGDVERISGLTSGESVIELQEERGIYQKVVQATSNLGFYIAHHLYLQDSHFVYPKFSSTRYLVIGFAIINIFLFGLLFSKIRKNAAYQIGFAVLFMCYLPISGIVYVPYMKFSLVSHHWWYPASMGFAILFGTLLSVAYESLCTVFKEHTRFQVSVRLITILGVLYFVTHTFALSLVFQDKESFLKKNLVVAPDSSLLRRLFAHELSSKKQYSEALQLLEQASLRNPYDDATQIQMIKLKQLIEAQTLQRSPASRP